MLTILTKSNSRFGSLVSIDRVGNLPYFELYLYSPTSPLKKTVELEDLERLSPPKTVRHDYPQSQDPVIDIVIIPRLQQDSTGMQVPTGQQDSIVRTRMITRLGMSCQDHT